MSNERSVAPKERVNILYRPSIGNSQDEVELPLKVLVVGDFTLRDDDTHVEDRKPISVDKDNFASVLKNQGLTVDFLVPNKLDDKGDPFGQLRVHYSIESLDDFSPDAIVMKVPELKQLVALRTALKALKGPMGNIPAFREQLQNIVQDEGVRQRLMTELEVKEG
jgi:type VI secretion system protein ImpB